MTEITKKKDNSQIEAGKARPRLLQGKITSLKMNKTAVVLVNRFKQHPKYKKRYLISKKYKAHNESGQYKIGDKAVIQECHPISKDKKWVIIEK